MRYSAKLLGLVVATAATMPFAQMAGGFGEEWHLLQPAIAQEESVADRKAKADSLLQQGLQHSQFSEALQSFEQALAIYREIGVREAFPEESRAGEGRALGNLGLVYESLGQYLQAIDSYEQALVIFREIGVREAFPEESRAREGSILGNLGNVYNNLGQYP